jgi:hypothetical protein
LKIKSNSSKDVNTSRSSSLSIKRSPRRMRSLFFTTTATSNQERRRLFLSSLNPGSTTFSRNTN